MSELKDLLLKNIDEITDQDIRDADDRITVIERRPRNKLIPLDWHLGRCRIYHNDERIVVLIHVELAGYNASIHLDAEPPIDTSDWPKRARLHKIQDPWS